MSYPQAIVKRWDAFWHQSISPEVYSILRMAFGIVGLIGLVGLLPLETFWEPGGVMPLAQGGVKGFLIDAGLGTVAGVSLFSVLLVGFMCMAVGYRSSWAVSACFVGSILQRFWNPLPLNGGNVVLGAVLLCLLWADCSAFPSIDSWLRARKVRGGVGNSAEPIWPLRLIRVQIGFIYVNSGLWKLLGPTWRDGSAIHYVLNLNTFRRFPVSPPPAFEEVLTLVTYATLFWEATFPLLVCYRRTRTIALVMGVCLHLGLWMTLELGSFSWVMIASYIAFLSPADIARWAQNLTSPTRRSSLE